MRSFDCGEVDIDGEVDADRVELLAGRRTEAHLVWDLRAGYENVAAAQLVSDPILAEIALAEFGCATELTNNLRLRCRRDEQAIDDTWVFVAPRKQSRPAQRHAVG